MKLFRKFLLGVLLMHSTAALSQDKVEHEVGVKANQIPVEARGWLRSTFETVGKPKWYQEFSELGYSFEAKFKYQNKFHSVEFDSLGKVLDVEIEIEWDEIPSEVKKNLMTYFNEDLHGVKLEKTQIQYSGLPEDLESFFFRSSD